MTDTPEETLWNRREHNGKREVCRLPHDHLSDDCQWEVLNGLRVPAWFTFDETSPIGGHIKIAPRVGLSRGAEPESGTNSASPSIECCVQCGEPKDTRNLKSGDEVANGWPACQNPSCVAFGQSVASAWFRRENPAPRGEADDPMKYPEALRKLGARLTEILDEDRWNEIEPLLHGLGRMLSPSGDDGTAKAEATAESFSVSATEKSTEITTDAHPTKYRSSEMTTATKEWSTADKSAWGDGAWQYEPDKVQWVDEATNLDCLAVRGPHGGWCGYVGVPESHPAFGKGYDDVDVSVHGGLTFADKCSDNSRELWERWRVQMKNGESEAERYPRGDAAERQRTLGHLRDDYEAWLVHHEATAICHTAFPGRPEHVWWLGFDCAHSGDLSPKYANRFSYGDRGDVYRTLDYVRGECTRLAAQLASPNQN